MVESAFGRGYEGPMESLSSNFVDRKGSDRTYIILRTPYEPSDAFEREICDFGYALKPRREIVYT
jgi:hypothetical protein